MKYSQWKKDICIGESILDKPRPEGLDPSVWDRSGDSWTLRPDAEQAVARVARWLRDKAGFAFTETHVIGSICSNCWRPGCDIDVHFVCPGIDPSQVGHINSGLRDSYKAAFGQDGVVFAGHPFELYVQQSPWKSYASVGCWDVQNRKWLAGPTLRPEGYDPVSEYWDVDMSSPGGAMLPQIRMQLMDALEKSMAVVETANPEFEARMSEELAQSLSAVARTFDSFRQVRRGPDAAKSAEEAVAVSQTDEWKISDSTYKTANRFGYVESMRACKNAARSGLTGKPLARMVVKDVAAAMQAEWDRTAGERTLDESWKSAIAGAALAGAAMFGAAPASAKVVEFPAASVATARQKDDMKEYYDRYFADMTKSEQTAKYGGCSFKTAVVIVASTLYGEGRSEIRNGGFDLISDSIVNRCAKIDELPGVCTANVKTTVKDKKTGRKKTATLYQYSFWNSEKTALEKIKAGRKVVPQDVFSNAIEGRAWQKCMERAKEMVRGEYKPTSRVNSYYRTKPGDPVPKWAPQMTDVQDKGCHRFGYVKTNDPKFVDMTTRKARAPKAPSRGLVDYTVKEGDTLSKIAMDHKTSWKKILADNPQLNGNPNKLAIGMKLKV